MENGSIHVIIAIGGDPVVAAGALGAATGTGPGAAPSVLLLPPPPLDASLSAMIPVWSELLGLPAASRIETFRPEPVIRGLLAGSRRWSVVELHPGSERFDQALVPATLAGRPVALAATLEGGFAASPVGLAAAFAAPRQTGAARFTRDRGAMAELASALAPSPILLAGGWSGGPFVARAGSLLAGQLLWLALRDRKPLAEGAGDWEQPEIQRLAAMEAMPARPENLHLTVAALDDARVSAAAALAHRLHDRLGPVTLTIRPD
jgi:hypothetical protein